MRDEVIDRLWNTIVTEGWDEPKIIVRFWLVSLLFALLALGTLKVR